MSLRKAFGPLSLVFVLLMAAPVDAGKVKAQTFEAQVEESFEAAAGTSLAVENLLGTIEVLPQPKGRTVRIRAEVTAEAVEAAEARRLAQEVRLVRHDEDGGVRWSVSFPDARLFRMPQTGVKSVVSKWLAPLVKKKTISTRYDGRAVEIGKARGSTAIAVNVKIEVPMDLTFSVLQHVGTIDCNGVRGDVKLQIKEGELHAGRLFGKLHVMTEGGSARVWGFNGDDLNVETGSGVVELKEIRSKQVRIDSARGEVIGNKIDTTHLAASTGSGKVLLEGLEPESLEVTSDTGSVELATELKNTRKAFIRSTTGDVTVRLGTFAPFQMEASSAGGAVKGSGTNVEIDQIEKNAAKLVRGKGGAVINVESQSGAITIRPL